MKRASLLLLLCSLCMAKCPVSQKPKLPVNSILYSLVRQKTGYSCGPAAMLSVFRYWDVYDGTEQSLYKLLKTDPENGTDPRNMVPYAQALGLKARWEEKVDIKKLADALKNGETVILDLQAWRTDFKTPYNDLWEDGHYIVLVGMDECFLYAMDPSIDNHYGYLRLSELMDRWHDYEETGGVLWKNYQLAMFFKGEKTHPIERAPGISDIK